MARRRIISLLIVLALAGFAGYRFLTRGIRVTVTNQSSETLTRVKLSWTGGSHTWMQMKPGERQNLHVVSRGESHLELEFQDASGTSHKQNAGGYFETNYRGWIDVSITPTKSVTWKESISHY